MALVRRLLFAGFNLGLVVGLIYLAVNAPTLLAGSAFQANPRLLDGTPVQSLLDVIEPNTVVVIQVWWKLGCEACYQQLQLLRSVHDPPTIYVIAVNVGGSEKRVAAKVEELGLEYPQVIGLPEFPQNSGGRTPYTEVWMIDDSGQFQVFDHWVGYLGKLNPKTQSLLDTLYEWLESQEGD